MRIVPIEHLRAGMTLGRTIIGSQGQILLKQGVELTEQYIKYLREHPLGAVYVSTGRDVVPEDVISDQTRLQAIQSTKDVLLNVKRGIDLEMEKVKKVLVSVIDELLLQDNIMINLVDLRAFSEDLFSHSVNVAVLALIVGIEYGYQLKSLKDLALAALLHDIGRLFTSDREAQEHVMPGVEFLQKTNIPPIVVKAVSQHHERWDGTGYPNRLEKEEITEYARIIQIANVFDKLSTSGYYSMEEVIEYLMAKSGSEFDPRAVRAFLNCVSFYPVGTLVELNTGEIGVVSKSNKGFPTRPVVQIEKNMYGASVDPAYSVDLVVKPTYFVKRRLETS